MKPPLKYAISFVAFFFAVIVSFAQDDRGKQWAIKFTGYQTKLSKAARATTDSVAAKMKADSNINYR